MLFYEHSICYYYFIFSKLKTIKESLTHNILLTLVSSLTKNTTFIEKVYEASYPYRAIITESVR